MKKYAFSFVGSEGFLGKDSTMGRIEDAIMFDERPVYNKYWELLQAFHPQSSLFHYYNPYRIAEIEVNFKVVREDYF